MVVSGMSIRSMQCFCPTQIHFISVLCLTLLANWVSTVQSMPPFLCIRWVRCSCMTFIRYDCMSRFGQEKENKWSKINFWKHTDCIISHVRCVSNSLVTTLRTSHCLHWMMSTQLSTRSCNWNTRRLWTWKVNGTWLQCNRIILS